MRVYVPRPSPELIRHEPVVSHQNSNLLPHAYTALFFETPGPTEDLPTGTLLQSVSSNKYIMMAKNKNTASFQQYCSDHTYNTADGLLSPPLSEMMTGIIPDKHKIVCVPMCTACTAVVLVFAAARRRTLALMLGFCRLKAASALNAWVRVSSRKGGGGRWRWNRCGGV